MRAKGWESQYRWFSLAWRWCFSSHSSISPQLLCIRGSHNVPSLAKTAVVCLRPGLAQLLGRNQYSQRQGWPISGCGAEDIGGLGNENGEGFGAGHRLV